MLVTTDGTVAGAVAWFECRVVDRFPAGDHHIVLAAPVHADAPNHNQRIALLYYNRQYAYTATAGIAREVARTVLPAAQPTPERAPRSSTAA